MGMDNKELLVAILKELFGPQLKGKYIVEYHGSLTVDADDKQDAIEKAKHMIQEEGVEINLRATKIEDLLKDAPEEK